MIQERGDRANCRNEPRRCSILSTGLDGGTLLAKLRLYWPLTKSLQTGLLLSTGLAGYMSARCPVMHWYDLLGLAVSLFLAISG